MTDDLSKDFCPVRDNFLLETCRSSVVTAVQIDPRERHIVSKLDRSELEDRYLRLQEDYQQLKKISNAQQDKIKRLATKLMRASATPRSCFTGSTLNGTVDKNKMELLEIENSKLKDKIVVLRNQILSHGSLNKSSSHSRKLQVYSSSRPTTWRSDTERLKIPSSQNSVHDREDDVMTQNYSSKIEELEMQKTQMMSRIADLESKLALAQTGNQKEKTAENIEYIRVWRQMKLQQDELADSESKNKSLMVEIEKLKHLLDETSRNSGQITATLLAEKNRATEINEKSQDNQLTLRERDEQIRDLTKEMEILQQHNAELINLSTNYNQVETETVEMKKKIQEILLENQSLKNSSINEQANTTALHAVNSQLVDKLQDLQKSMDSLTIEFKALKNQRNRSEKDNSEVSPPIPDKLPIQIPCPAISNDHEPLKIAKNYCICTQTTIETNQEPKKPVKQIQFEEVGIQTDFSSNSLNKTTENNTKKSPKKIDSNTQTVCYNNEAEKLSPERMLKLLDDAQINTPLDSQSVIKIREIDELYSTNSKSNRQSIPEGESSSDEVCEELEQCEVIDAVYNILQDYCQSSLKQKDPPETESTLGESSLEEKNSVARKLPSCTSVCRETRDDSDQESNQTFVVDHSKPIFGDNAYELAAESPPNGVSECVCIESKITTCFTPKIRCKSDTTVQLSCSELKNYPSTSGVKMESRLEIKKSEDLGPNKCMSNCSKKRRETLREGDRGLGNGFEGRQLCQGCKEDYERLRDSKCILLSTPRDGCFPIALGDHEGFVEIHTISLKLSPRINNDTIYKRFLFINCKFFDHEPMSTSVVKYPQLTFNSYSIYRVADLDKYLKYILYDHLCFQLNVILDAAQVHTIAQGKINIKDALMYPHNKLHYMVALESTVPDCNQVICGELTVSVKLSCDIDRLKMFKDQNARREVKKSLSDLAAAQSDVFEPEIVQEVVRYHGLCDKPSEVLSKHSINQFEPSNWCLVPQKSSNLQHQDDKLSLMDLEEDETLPEIDHLVGFVLKKNYSGLKEPEKIWKTLPFSQINSEDDAVVIKIDYLKLDKSCALLSDPSVYQLFIDYTFLGRHGPTLETASIRKPTSHTQILNFNYIKKFFIDDKRHWRERDYLRSMIHGETRPFIEFNVVSEPPREEMNDKDCVDVGQASFNLAEHIAKDGNPEIYLNVQQNQGEDSIGVLKISFFGTNVINKCLLQPLRFNEL